MRILLAVALAVLLSNTTFARDLPDKTRIPKCRSNNADV